MRQSKNKFIKLRSIFLGIVCLLLVVETLAPVRVRADKLLTLEDYLASGGNIFTDELDSLKEEIQRSKGVLDAIPQKMDIEICAGNLQDSRNPMYLYKSSGFEINASTFEGFQECEAAARKKITQYANQAAFSSISLQNGSTYSGFYISLVGYFREEVESYYEEKKHLYDKKATYYSGFGIVGVDNNGTFQVGITKNTIFRESWKAFVDSELYGRGDNSYAAYNEDVKQADKTEKYIAEPLGNGAWSLYEWLRKWDIDLSIDGLVYGRMAGSYRGTVDLTHFGLEANNPYGIVAASAYYVLRRILLSALPVIVMVLLLFQLPKNTNKGRAQLKEMATRMLWIIALLFAAPYLINLCIYFRDGVLRFASIGMGSIFQSIGLGEGVGSSIIGVTYAVYENNHSLVNALVWCASVGSGFFFLATYLRMAILLTGCVAILPLVLFMAVWNKKILESWFNIFFPNMCAPLIDVILLQIPSIVLLVYKRLFGASGGSIVLGIVLIMLIWSTLAVRERIIKLLGFEGFGGGGKGFLGMLGAMGAAAMMMMRGMGGGRGRSGGDREDKPDISSKDGETLERERGRIYQDARKAPMDDVPMGEEVSYNSNLAGETDSFLESMDAQYGGGADEEGVMPGDIEPMEGEGFSAEGALPEGADEIPEMGEMEENALSFEELSDVPYDEDGFVGDSIDYTELPEGEFAGGETYTTMSDVEGLSRQTISEVPSAGEEVSVGEHMATEQAGTTPADMPVTPSQESYSGISASQSPGPIPEIEPVYNEEFRNSLSDATSRARYENLAQIDAYKAEISKNEATMRNSGYTSRSEYVEERKGYAEQLTRLDNHIEASKARLDGITDKTSKEYLAEQNTLAGARNQRAQVQERIRQLDHAAQLDRANQTYESRVSTLSGKEKGYARAESLGGMNGRVYENAQEYIHQTKLDDAKKSLANYRNFDSKRFEGVLTPAERENYYRERTIHERREKLLHVAGTAAKVAVGTAVVGAAATASVYSAYGGSNASAQAASATAIGGMVAGKVGGRVVGGAAGKVAHKLPTNKDGNGGNNKNKPQTGKRPSQPTSPKTVSDSQIEQSRREIEERARRAEQKMKKEQRQNTPSGKGQDVVLEQMQNRAKKAEQKYRNETRQKK